MKNIFITFEGGEGTGKTTLIDMLHEDLVALGYQVMKTREPGGSKIAELIRTIILDKENIEMDYKAEAMLYAASRRQHLIEVIKPALARGEIVLCDRYVDSSIAYQGYARGLGMDEVWQLNDYAIDGFLPTITILIDIQPEIGLKRIKSNKRSEDRLDLESLAFHQKVREGYLLLAKKFPERIIIVPGEKDRLALYHEVKKRILQVL